MTYGVGMVGRVRARVGELENTPGALPRPQGPRVGFSVDFGSNVVPYSGLGLLLSLFDTYVLTTTRDESAAHFVMVNIPVYHDTYETYKTTTRRRVAHDYILFHNFCYFQVCSPPGSPF